MKRPFGPRIGSSSAWADTFRPSVIECSQVIEELIQMAKDMQEAMKRRWWLQLCWMWGGALP